MKKIDILSAVIIYPTSFILLLAVKISCKVIEVFVVLHKCVWSASKEYAKCINHVDSPLLSTVWNLGGLCVWLVIMIAVYKYLLT